MWRLIPLLLAGPAFADSVVATRDLGQSAVVTADDITLVAMEIPGALTKLEDVIGQIATRDILAGRAVSADQITQPIRVMRNDLVRVTLRSGALEIHTDGRAMSEGGVGDVIDIMNLSSRMRIQGRIGSDGNVHVIAGQ
jgi:flagella basal body P-ring formation protein FlgA